ncbi:MAG: DNA recombination protein RmuC [Prevotellaceae bacterium]|jgi:DNA recombination protein RmuC|nr:DNA recombination protein RmuC [Prevotellaceae bacterium]
MQTIILVLLGLLIIAAVVNIRLSLRGTAKNDDDIKPFLVRMDENLSRIDSLIREEFGRNRDENRLAFKDNREELSNSFKLLSENLTKTVTDLSGAQKSQFDTFSQQLNNLVKTFDEKIKNLISQSENAAKDNRSELNTSFKLLGETLTKTVTDLSNAQKNQFESYSNRLAELTKSFDDKTKSLQEQLEKSAKENRTEQSNSLKSFEDKFTLNVKDFNELQKQKFDDLVNRQDTIKKETEIKLKEIRETVESKLTHLQEDNNRKLEEMRKTVDEKLQESVEKRFNESFKLINERLEAVHKGLGEMQTLATGVGDLKKVLTNVKTRGTFGEVQLGAILEQVLSPEQYAKNEHPGDDRKVVEYSIKLPGKNSDGEPVFLPIDSKFPIEDYQRLVDAYENKTEMVDYFGKQFENSVKTCAKDICEKYIKPPKTTDFAILFVPTEGLYAEILRRPGFFEMLQRAYRVTVVGPTNLVAFLSSLQMGFRTLAIEKRSSEVWEILGAVKTEFGNFGTILGKTQKKLQEAANVIEKAGTRSRAIERKLRTVQELPQEQTVALLGEAIEIEQEYEDDDTE